MNYDSIRITEAVFCPKCNQPVTSAKKAEEIQKQLDWADKEKEFKRQAEEYRRKNPVTPEKGWGPEQFFPWFDKWILSQNEKHVAILRKYANKKICKLYMWIERKAFLIDLATSLKEMDSD